MKSQDTVELGAKQAISTCLKVKPGENVVIVTDRETEKIANALAFAVRSVGATFTKFVMEDFGARSVEGTSPLEFPQSIADEMALSQVSLYAAQCYPGELASFRQKMCRCAVENRVRHAHMPQINEAMMKTGMTADYYQIKALSKKVFNILSSSRFVSVTAPAGSKFTIELDQSRHVVVDDGDIKPDCWGNLPAGEVFAAPIDANGIVTIDGVLSRFSYEENLLLAKNPLSYRLKDGWCVRDSVDCLNFKLRERFIQSTYDIDENSNRLGEFGVGTNIGLNDFIGISLQDEKFPGVHLALGDPYPDETGADWSSGAHQDGIIRRPTIVVDSKLTIMKDGVFTI